MQSFDQYNLEGVMTQFMTIQNYEIVNRLISAESLTDNKILLSTNNNEKFTVEGLKEGLTFLDSKGELLSVEFDVEIADGKIYLKGDFSKMAFEFISYVETTVKVMKTWKYKDNKYFYKGDLGATLNDDGRASLKIWSPSADHVTVVLYDKVDQSKIVKSDIAMSVNNKGVWSVVLNKENTGLDNLNSYLYHYEIDRAGVKTLVLDPYAKSLGQWHNKNEMGHNIAKAAIINPSKLGPELDYAKIEGYESREDAIIYELHVRDFTSDPTLEGKLDSKYGTFNSFVEKLDYLEDLGITHVQLLPVMSYYFANEFVREARMLEYESEDTDYNWGYDPQSYFALTGMYSEDPSNPELRVVEFKNLVNEIHKRGMGIILDVVYNHTASVSIFEDLEPNYYHFMNADGSSRTSFGGGRLGTSHLMSRRVLIDSILYMVAEYKVDGFRFDMMGDHDAQTIQIAFERSKKLNPNILMIGEGWITYAGDEGEPLQGADQHWMKNTDAVGSFSDEIRNELKSGFSSLGQARFLSNGKRNMNTIYQNMVGNPGNFIADDAGDVVQYIAAHDNLTLYDVIAQSIKKDPSKHNSEILKRVRLGNTMILTAQGTIFLHGGQEYGRTKQFLALSDSVPYKSTYMVDVAGKPFENPYFIHDSYDSSDIINRFDWNKVMDEKAYPQNVLTKNHMKGMISLRRSTDAFSYDLRADIDKYVSRIESKDIQNEDLVLAMKNISKANGDIYYLFVNADENARTINFDSEVIDLDKAMIISDGVLVNIKGIVGLIESNKIELDALSSLIIKVSEKKETDLEIDKVKSEALIN